MTQEINLLYNKNMNNIIKEDSNFREIDRTAREISKKEGIATVIRVRHGLPRQNHSTIYIKI